MYLNFSNELYLFFLFAIPVLIFLHFYGLKNLKGRSLKFANFQAIARVKGIDLYSKNLSILFLNISIVALLVFALSGLTINRDVDASSFSYILVIDASESMTAVDIKPDRLSGAKEVALNFIDSLPEESYVGIVSFSGDSYIEKHLTKNKQDLKTTVDSIEVSYVKGTDIYEAIFNSGKLLKESKDKAIILLSDGQANVGRLDSVIDYAVDNKIVIHSIGIGTVEGGEAVYGISRLNEDFLKAVSYNTGGSYFRADDEEKIKDSFNQIIEVVRKMGSTNIGPYLLMVSIVLFVFKQFLVLTNRVLW
ncbi:VWA domain-containing protein [Candidatus Pacearchaeota archaeon]|nr:VWA domain-containing protein [Candidatus Pacearchaeota archaeon]MBD3283648.1 VWA domain-containing protein [Candidatus Pacearchaeota archaeon]